MYRHGSDGDILSCLQGQCDKSTAPQPTLASVISDKTEDIRKALLQSKGAYPRHVKKQAVSGETSQLLSNVSVQKYEKDFRYATTTIIHMEMLYIGAIVMYIN